MTMKKNLWNEFLSRKKCMCCEKRWQTQYYKPYCLSCFKKEKNDELYKTIRVYVSNEERTFIKKYLDERYEKIKLQNYDFIDDKKYTCTGYGECLFLSFDNNNKIVANKNPNFECKHDCKLCKRESCFTKAPTEILDIHNGICMNCDMNDFKNKKGAYNIVSKNNAIEL